MARTIHAQQDDTVDAICYRVFGYTARVVEQVLERNPGLADIGPILPQGTAIILPSEPEQPKQQEPIKLWD